MEKQNLVSLFQSMAIGIVYQDSSGKIISANQAAEALLGLSQDQLMGRTSMDPEWHAIHPDGSLFPGETHPAMQALQTGKPVHNTPMGIYNPDQKKYTWILINAYPEFEKGKDIPYQVFTTFTDVSDLIETEKKLVKERRYKRAENKLHQSEQQYKTLFEGSPDPYLIIHEGRVIECNQPTLDLLKTTKQDFIGKAPHEFSPELQPNGRRSADYAAEIIEETFRTGVTTFEWTHLKTDGTPVIVDVKVTTTEYNNKPVLLTTWRDISALKQAQATIEATTERFNEVTKHSRSVIWEVDLSGKYLYVSEAASTVFGYSANELIGKYFFDLHPTSDRATYAKNGLALLSTGNEIIDFPNPIIRKDNTLIWVSTNGTPIRNNEGKLIGYKGVDTDITSRKIAEDEVKKFRTISDQANYGTAITDMQGILLYCNERFANKHGYTIDELLGKPLFVLHNESQLPRIHELLDLIKTEGGFSAEEVDHCKKDGTVFPTLMSAQMILDENGKPAYLSATVIDISNIKEVEKKLKEKSTELNNAQLIANMGSWELDLITNTTKWSDNYYRILEVSRDTKPDTHIFNALLHPDDKDLIRQKEAKLIQTKQPVSFEMRLVMHDKRIKWIQNNVVGIFKEDKLVALKGVNIDITEKKIQQDQIKIQNDRLSAIIEAMPDLIFISDREGNYLEFIRSGHKIDKHGYANMVGKNIGELYGPELTRQHLANIQKCLDTGERITYEYEWNDQEETIYYEGTIVKLDKNRVLRFVRDISDRKKIQNELKVLNHDLEKRIHERTRALERSNVELLYARVEADEANKSKSEFLSRMSHELRTPMNAILGFAQLLEMSELTEPQTKSVHHILRSGKHLLDLINEVLDIARIEAGKVSISVEAVSVKEIIDDCMDTIQPLAASKNIHLHADIEERIFVKADQQRLKQVMINIITNAIKYNRDNGEVWIKTATIPSLKGTRIRLMVKDTGMGIHENDLPKVFMPFERIGAEQHTIEGTGLGLAVVKQLTELMGGTVGVESIEGQGTTFWVDLAESISELQRVKSNGDLQQIATATDAISGTILYVEDNISNVELIEQIIQTKRKDIRLEVVMYGRQAVPKAEEINPKLILLDLNLPDIHGDEVLAQLKANFVTAAIPVIVISADAMPAQISKLKEAGASDYLTKPIELTQLLTVIDHFMTKK